MAPTIKTFDPFTVVGLSARFISAMSPDANNFAVIPKLWAEYLKRSGEIKSRLSPTEYGLVLCLDEKDNKSHPDEMLYIVGASVPETASTPPGMTRLTIPAGKYVVFVHKGPVQALGQTMKEIYVTWLPKSGMKIRNAPHLEIYDHRFKPASPDSEIDICVPVQ